MYIHNLLSLLCRDWVGLWRKDRRCGAEFPLPDGSGPTECNPESENFCCSKWGYCTWTPQFGDQGPPQSKGAVEDGVRGQAESEDG